MVNDTFYYKQTSINFTVKNLSPNRKIHIFNYPLMPGQTRDLLAIPGISEGDIRHSLIKGELANFIRMKVIAITSSTIDLMQFDAQQDQFIVDAATTLLDSSVTIGSIIYGNGDDGAALFDGTLLNTSDFTLLNGVYTQIRDCFLTNGSIVSPGVTVYTAGYRLFCSGILTNNGTIHNNGKNAVGATAGGASALGSLGVGVGGGNGRSNNTGVNGQATSNGLYGYNSYGGNGGAGGVNAGGTGGVYTSVVNGNGGAHWLFPMHSGFLAGQSSGGNQAQLSIIGGGGGGAGGGSDSLSATGGGGGGAGGVMILHALHLINNGVISANGGNGANATGTSGNAGGGGGGGGGFIFQCSRFRSGTGTITASGGLGGSGYGTGVAGSSGGAGESEKFTA